MSKQLHVLHFTTHNEDCGIGKYQEQFLRAMSGDETVIHNEIFLYSPNKTKMMVRQSLDMCSWSYPIS